ncbi:MAG: hypothetical protein AB7P04_07445 [Bacteriovoracia bacterium]
MGTYFSSRVRLIQGFGGALLVLVSGCSANFQRPVLAKEFLIAAVLSSGAYLHRVFTIDPSSGALTLAGTSTGTGNSQLVFDSTGTFGWAVGPAATTTIFQLTPATASLQSVFSESLGNGTHRWRGAYWIPDTSKVISLLGAGLASYLYLSEIAADGSSNTLLAYTGDLGGQGASALSAYSQRGRYAFVVVGTPASLHMVRVDASAPALSITSTITATAGISALFMAHDESFLVVRLNGGVPATQVYAIDYASETIRLVSSTADLGLQSGAFGADGILFSVDEDASLYAITFDSTTYAPTIVQTVPLTSRPDRVLALSRSGKFLYISEPALQKIRSYSVSGNGVLTETGTIETNGSVATLGGNYVLQPLP